MKIEISKVCPFCGAMNIVEVEEKAYTKWQNGELIQRAMPNKSSAERETLITGLCLKCQAKFFGDQEE